jgi:uncharacterized protein (DUF433 family)
MKFTRITSNPGQMGGMPCIRGLRIPVATVVGMIAGGMSETEIWRPIRTWKAVTFTRRSGTQRRR